MNRKLQVFVSSTYSDLKDERQAAVEAILKSGNIPAGMELFTAGSLSQMDVIKRWIDESDVYMLILGGRYGSIEASTGLSYTELEYDYAREQGKPIFAVVIDDDALDSKIRSAGATVLEKENPQLLKQFRAKVLQSVCAFFKEVKDIKLTVHESMSDYKADPKLKGWVSGDALMDSVNLNDEVKRLKQENEELITKLQAASDRKGQPISSEGPIGPDTLLKALQLIEVLVPENASSSGKAFTSNLLHLAYTYKDAMVTGVINTADASATINFLYYNILPKLELHGLAETEAGGNYFKKRKLTAKGKELLAKYEVNRALAKAKP